MIKNGRQYRLTKAQADRFSQTLQSLGEIEECIRLLSRRSARP